MTNALIPNSVAAEPETPFYLVKSDVVAGATNTLRPLTHPSGMSRIGGLAVNATQEQWRPVVGYEGLYEVSDQGRVRGLARTVLRLRQGQLQELRRKPLMLKPRVKSSGHLEVKLYNSGTHRIIHVHRLVLAAFIGPCPPGMECLHANDDGADNRLTNLSWGTRSENVLDRVRNGVHHNTRKTHCLRGHEFTAENTVGRADRPNRICVECSRIRNAAQALRKAQGLVI